MRRCPLFNCGEPIKSVLFACLKHWRMLTLAQQRTIYAAWEDWKIGNIDGKRLLAVQQQVIDAVQKRRKP